MPRPRRTKDASGTVVGALVGAAIGGPLGAALAGATAGGLLGTAANPQEPLPLDLAVAQYFAARGLVLVTLKRPSKISASAIFKAPQGSAYFQIKAFVPPRPGLKREAIDDALYDQLATRVNAWLEAWRVGS
jgi:hypothetical protein